MDIWTGIELATNAVDAGLLVLLLNSFFTKRFKGSWPSMISFIIGFSVITLFNYLNINMSYTLGVYIVLCIILGFVIYQGSIITRIFIPILFGALLIVSELLVMVLLKGIFPHLDSEVFLQSNQYRVFGIFLSKIIFFILIKLAARFAIKQSIRLPLQYTLMLLLVPITSIVVLDTILKIELSQYTLLNNSMWMAIASGCLLCINMLVYFLFENLCRDFSKLNEYQMMEQQMALLENHLKEMEASKKETQSIWHDIKNHITSIRGLVQKKKYSELIQYTETMFEQLGNAIENVQTGHPVVDALLGSKVAVAKQSNIKMDIDARIPPGIPIEAFDISVVISNAVDNAIEACHRIVNTEDRVIEVSMYVKKECLFITVKNAFEGNLKLEDNTYVSTKADTKGHGIGISNIKRTIKKYNGHLKIATENQVFNLMAMMFFDHPIKQSA